ncbi:MAG: gliding motility-associated C-terminal domain-containing protein [Saprospiraceae bacterium]|nr:gliding motility-associated C-terminal domain-containing protein [Saprospiraceae bacterium]
MNSELSGNNDVIYIQSTDLRSGTIKSFNVFERGGRMVHSGKNLTWNVGGNALPQGLYYYTIEAEVDVCGTLKNIKKTGSFAILR